MPLEIWEEWVVWAVWEAWAEWEDFKVYFKTYLAFQGANLKRNRMALIKLSHEWIYNLQKL